eukprot:Lithocolla_globosa_v1_NODE_10332_length_610_cov_2.468468.p1 type:complete len:100 gc:universal NODE_10332_length_610_cov_2.468468:250-549(+)
MKSGILVSIPNDFKYGITFRKPRSTTNTTLYPASIAPLIHSFECCHSGSFFRSSSSISCSSSWLESSVGASNPVFFRSWQHRCSSRWQKMVRKCQKTCQ